jgi:choline dehydrogenase-like flavoprotein
VDYDVVIIGSGAGGGACAWGLAGRGVRVLVLEAGPRFDPARDYRLSRPQWEQSGFPELPGSQWKHTYGAEQTLDPAWDRLHSWNHITGRIVRNGVRQYTGYQHVRGVGGTTLHFSAEAHRLHPTAMRMRSRFGVGADWPIAYDELEPYYCEAEQVIGAAGPALDTVRHRSQPYPQQPHVPSYASQRMIAASRARGFKWVANSLGVLSAPYDGRPPCNYCNNCHRGCPRGDKASVDVTFLRKAEASGACTIISGAQVVRIEAGKADRVTEVVYADTKGRMQTVTGRAVAVAGGAVQTPRLLLASGSTAAPDGLANENGQVGRHFMETIFHAAAGLHSDQLGSWRGLPHDIICWDYNAPDAIPGVIGGCRLMPITASMELLGPIAYATRVVKGWGPGYKRAVREAFGRAIAIGGIAESLPHPQAYVDLDPWSNDAHGIPLARIHAYMDDMALARQAFMADRALEVLRAMGVEHIFEQQGSYDQFSSSHVFGTCRMGDDARESVVDRDCRSHRWKNLFVVDASVFPSSGGGEAPSLTIEALALRAAGKIADLMTRREL